MSEDENGAMDEAEIESKKKALEIVARAFGECEASEISGLIAVGAFLDHIIAHLVSMNDRDMTSQFLESLAGKVRQGIYDQVVDDQPISGGTPLEPENGPNGGNGQSSGEN